MRRSATCILLAVMMALAACGGGDDEAASARVTPGPPVEAQEQEAAEQEIPDPAAEAPGEGAAEQQAQAPAPQQPAPAQQAPAPAPAPQPGAQAPANRASIPPIGNYVYAVTAEGQGTGGGPGATPQAGGGESTMAQQVTEHRPIPTGTEVIIRSSGGQGGQTTTMWWENDRVLLVRLVIQAGQMGNFECDFRQPDGTPGIVIMRFPLQVEQLPRQQWSNNQCSGEANISVLGHEVVEAAGRTWNAWRIDSTQTIRYGTPRPFFTANIQQAAWLAPELGMDVRQMQNMQGEASGPQGGSGSGSSTRVLQSHP